MKMTLTSPLGRKMATTMMMMMKVPVPFSQNVPAELYQRNCTTSSSSSSRIVLIVFFFLQFKVQCEQGRTEHLTYFVSDRPLKTLTASE